MNEDTRPLMVSIWCITYNHEPYIRQCLDGFVMQKTNFRFEAIVHDDASTDGTVAIVREYAEKYPDIIKPILETENQYSKHDGSLDRIMNEKCTGKYIALCEGDDYWIDPHKLQTQVDLLENNPNLGMCYTRYVICENGILQKQAMGGPSVEFNDLLKENTIATLTTLCRNSLFSEYSLTIKPEETDWKMGDYPCWLWFSVKSKIGFIDNVTGVYRLLPESASHSKSLHKVLGFIDSKYEIQSFFNDFFNAGMSKEIQRTYYVHQLYEISKYEDIKLCLSKLRLAIKNDPSFLLSYKGYIYLLRTCKNKLIYILKKN